jgi:Flp pilus assembly protein TadD
MRAQDTAMDFGIPLAVRLENAAVSLSVYLRQQFVPSQFSVFYPYEMPLPGFAVLMGVVSAAYLAYAAFFCWKRCPVVTLAIGWFVAGLVPVIGLIHVGSASRADRYTYLPALGVSLLAAWAVSRYLEAARRSRTTRAVALAGLVAVCATQALLARDYLAVWENSGTLFAHAARVTRNNAMAHTNAGGYYLRMPEEKGRVTFHYRKALEYERSAKSLGNMALWIMMNMGEAYLDEAGALAAEGMLQPRRSDDYVILDAMGYYLIRRGAYADAEALLRESVALCKTNPVTWEWLAVCCFKQRKYLDAAVAAQEAARRNPKSDVYPKMVSVALRQAVDVLLPQNRW